MTTDRLQLTLSMNPEFAKAYANGEKWALDYAEASLALDGESTRRHPDRARHEDGVTRRNWCGACSHSEGCVQCDLDHPTGDAYRALKGTIGKDIG